MATLNQIRIDGFGAMSRGGEGGDTYTVTTLANDGPGSFRQALWTQDGPRNVVFDVGGTIRLEDVLFTRKPYLTIAGETAPCPGITLADHGLTIKGAHDIVIRHIRSRLGDHVERDGSSLFILDCHDVHVSHCSVSWGTDENGAAWTSSEADGFVGNVTFSWCIFSEGLLNSVHTKGAHSMGCIGAVEGLTIHHCLFAHNNMRNPFIRGRADLVNNVVYNWGSNGTHIDIPVEDPLHLLALGPARVNLDNCWYQSGPSTGSVDSWFRAFEHESKGRPLIWDSGGTIVDGNANPVFVGSPSEGDAGTFDWATERHPYPRVKTDAAAVAYKKVLKYAGASIHRDAVDKRIVADVKNGTGRIIDSQDEVGGWV